MTRGEYKVKWFNTAKGFGFLETPNGDAFVHFTECHPDFRGESGFTEMDEGQKVTALLEETDRGWQALEVRPVGVESENRKPSASFRKTEFADDYNARQKSQKR